MQKQKTYKELLDGMSYRELGYTGAPSVTDPKLKAFNDTILKNDEISQTKINNTPPFFKGQRRVAGAEVKTGASTDVQTDTGSTVLTAESPYSDFEKWAATHGYDTKQFLSDAMAQADQQYAQARATYGRQAEQLAQAGLTNSGVSDNLERVAYAQKVQAEQAALKQADAYQQANKEGFAAYQEEQKQKQQQYNNAYLQLLSGYTDDEGNYHAPVSNEMALAQLRYAGLNDETMIANAQKAYADYKAVYDQQQTDRQNAIAGIDSTTDADGNTTVNGFSADSLFGKLFSGDMSSDEFLAQIEDDYGVRFNTDEEAVAALLKEGIITKEQSSLFYREMINNSLEAIAETGLGAKEILSEGKNNPLYQTVAEAHQAYKDGKMSKEDWDAFRKGLLSADSPIHITVDKYVGATNDLNFKLQIGDSTYSMNVMNFSHRVVTDDKKAKTLDSLADGMNIAVYEGNLYIKSSEGFGESAKWIRVGNVSGTQKANIKKILKMLAEA